MLEKSLLINSLFSFFSSFVILVANKWLSEHIPMPEWLWIAIGIGLLGFAVFLVLMLKIKSLLTASALTVVMSDCAWVVITTIAAVVFATRLTVTGTLLVLMVNLVVGLLAWFQYMGFQKTIIAQH